jgi:hypothetical protein
MQFNQEQIISLHFKLQQIPGKFQPKKRENKNGTKVPTFFVCLFVKCFFPILLLENDQMVAKISERARAGGHVFRLSYF